MSKAKKKENGKSCRVIILIGKQVERTQYLANPWFELSYFWVLNAVPRNMLSSKQFETIKAKMPSIGLL